MWLIDLSRRAQFGCFVCTDYNTDSGPLPSANDEILTLNSTFIAHQAKNLCSQVLGQEMILT